MPQASSASGVPRLSAHHRQGGASRPRHPRHPRQLRHPQASQGQGLARCAARWQLHFIPTYSSWLNLVERFFAHISAKAIRRGSFRPVPDLVAKIDHFVSHHNQTCQPFVWTATADSILAKLQRLCSRINGTKH